jgi:hypothetical protein
MSRIQELSNLVCNTIIRTLRNWLTNTQLTNSMEKISSWETINHSATEDNPGFYWTRKFLFCSQDLATESCPVTNEPSPPLQKLFLSNLFYYCCIPRVGSYFYLLIFETSSTAYPVHIQWVSVALSPGESVLCVKLTTHLNPAPRLRMCVAKSLLSCLNLSGV